MEHLCISSTPPSDPGVVFDMGESALDQFDGADADVLRTVSTRTRARP